MTKDDVTRMAREAGFTIGPATREIYSAPGGFRAELERFAALVAAAEREACAKVLDEMALDWEKYVTTPSGTIAACAAALRARGETK